MGLNYKDAGVDIVAGDALVDWLKETQPKNQPFEDSLVSGIGGFSAIMRLPFPEMKKPCLVSATDGIGTKLMLAIEAEDYTSIGQDLVAMCVNDLICCGARPLFFLDYFATSKLELPMAKELLGGVRQACIDSNCLLIGGETAEMPGLYKEKDFDCAGFAVGMVDEDAIIGRHKVTEGLDIIGVSSSGFHSNGFSLIRKVYANQLKDKIKELIRPTALYVKLAASVVDRVDVKAMAHITGGGIDNLTRVLPEGVSAQIKHWDFPQLFQEFQDSAKMSREEMYKTFNCGIGLMILVPKEQSNMAVELIKGEGFEAYRLGQTASGSRGIEFIE